MHPNKQQIKKRLFYGIFKYYIRYMLYGGKLHKLNLQSFLLNLYVKRTQNK